VSDNRCSTAFFLLVLCVLVSGNVSRADSAQNASSTDKKKAAEDAAVVEKFAAWKATLSSEQQAWETVLEENLGSFYLPIYQREKIAGKVTAWDYVKDVPVLPRVLLIGDSVSRGYTLAVRKELEGIANVHRAPENCGPTSNALKKLDVWLGDGHWDVIHVNFGLHEIKTPLADYTLRLEEIMTRLQATGATLIWASTTPVPEDWSNHVGQAEVIVRLNKAAAGVMQQRQIPIDDLYEFALPRLKEIQNPQDIHFKAPGYELLGRQVAASIAAQLSTRKTKERIQ